MPRTQTKAPPGWTPRTAYGIRVTQNDILGSTFALATRRDEFDVARIIVDDGWQEALGDWLRCNSKFPSGLRTLAREIRMFGFQAELWTAPFLAEQTSQFVCDHPDWLMCGERGMYEFPKKWRDGGRAAVPDFSRPEVCGYFRDLYAEIRGNGFERVILDYASAPLLPGIQPASGTAHDALNHGLAAIREGFGKTGFLTICEAPEGLEEGIADAVRKTPWGTPPDVEGILTSGGKKADLGIFSADAPENLLLAAALAGGNVTAGGVIPSITRDELGRFHDMLDLRGRYRLLPDALPSEPGTLVRRVRGEHGRILFAVFNLTDEPKTIRLKSPKTLFRMFAADRFPVKNGTAELRLKASDAMICEPED